MGRGIHVLVPLLLWVGLLTVRGDVSELDGLRDQPPIRIGAFNIQIFGKNKFNDPGVVPELVKVRLCGMFIQQWMHKSCFCWHRFALGTIYLWLVYKLFMMTYVLVEKNTQFAYIPFWFFLYRKNIVSCIKFKQKDVKYL